MDKCPNPEKLNAFFDERLDQQAAGEISTHLQACESCRKELERFGELRQLLRSAKAAIWTEKQQKLAIRGIRSALQSQKAPVLSFVRRLAAVAALLAVSSFVFLAFSARQDTQTQNIFSPIAYIEAGESSLPIDQAFELFADNSQENHQ